MPDLSRRFPRRQLPPSPPEQAGVALSESEPVRDVMPAVGGVGRLALGAGGSFPPPGNDWTRQHRRPGRGLGWLVIVAVVLLLVAAGGGAVWWARGGHSTSEPVASSCPEPELRVVAAPEIAPVVEAAASGFDTFGSCARIAVIAEQPDVTAAAPAARQPDVWIPSSSAWLRIAAAGGVAYTNKGAPIAVSPIELAAPAPIAGLYAKGDQTSWATLTEAVAKHDIPAVTMPDPLHSTVGLLSVYGVQAAMARTTSDAGIAQLRAFTLRSRLDDAVTDPVTVLQKLAAQNSVNDAIYQAGVFPTTEQQLTVYQRGGHTVELAGAYPADGLVEADYPYAVAKNVARRQLADELRAAISGSAVTAAGFRTSALPDALTLPARPEQLLGPARQWAGYRRLSFQVLLLIDASGSMGQPATDRAGHETTKDALLRQSGAAAAQLFSDETNLGLWYFSSDTPASPAHVEAVPFGPVGAPLPPGTRRDVLAASLGGYRPAEGAGTPLYQSVLDGEAAMRARAKPGTVTLVVVLTDGRDGGSRFAMSNQAFLSKLAAGRDAARPVPIMAVGYGPDADMKALNAMSAATGGQAIAATNPADLASALAKAFLAAHLPG